MVPPFLHATVIFFLRLSSANMMIIDTVQVDASEKFPIELGGKITWRISPLHGSIYDATAGFSFSMDTEVVASYSITCEYLMPTNIFTKFIQCGVERDSVVILYYTPAANHYGKQLSLIFYKNLRATYSHSGQLLINATIHLIKQPTFLKMSLSLDMVPDYARNAPLSLKLRPPIFLDGSMATAICETDGALPSSPISFSISCPSPSKASVERDKRSRMQMGYPYSVHYQLFNFHGPPTDEELADYLSSEYAKEILREVRISTSPDNLTTTASIPIISKAHNCSLFCRLMNKEERIQLTVYYQTTLAYILPITKDGLMYAGSSVTCFADGFPDPSISLFLKQPLKQSKTKTILDSHDYLVSTSPLPPTDLLSDDSAVSSTARIGLRPDEYIINGPTFSLSYNATPGVELLLVCTAGNALPGALDFLGTNKTIATARFVVSAISYSRLGLVLGLCLTLLLISLVIILTMVVLKRRKKNASGYKSCPPSTEKAGAETTVDGYLQDSAKIKTEHTNETLSKMRSSLVNNDSLMQHSTPHTTSCVLTTSPDLVYATPSPSSDLVTPATVSDEVEYAVLSFDNSPKKKKYASSTLDRRFRSPVHRSPSDSRHAQQSVLSKSTDDETSNYSVIVGTMQPKWCTNTLVLKQQQDAMQILLAAKKDKPSVFV